MTEAPNDFLTQLYIDYSDQLRSFALAHFPQKDLSEDLVHEVFAIACVKQQELMNSPNQRGWLTKTLKYVICNHYRKQETELRTIFRYVHAYKDRAISSDALVFEQLYADIANTEEYILLKERVIDELSYRELAAKYKITIPNCRKRLQRAKEILRKNFFDYLSQNGG